MRGTFQLGTKRLIHSGHEDLPLENHESWQSIAEDKTMKLEKQTRAK